MPPSFRFGPFLETLGLTRVTCQNKKRVYTISRLAEDVYTASTWYTEILKVYIAVINLVTREPLTRLCRRERSLTLFGGDRLTVWPPARPPGSAATNRRGRTRGSIGTRRSTSAAMQLALEDEAACMLEQLSLSAGHFRRVTPRDPPPPRLHRQPPQRSKSGRRCVVPDCNSGHQPVLVGWSWCP